MQQRSAAAAGIYEGSKLRQPQGSSIKEWGHELHRAFFGRAACRGSSFFILVFFLFKNYFLATQQKPPQ